MIPAWLVSVPRLPGAAPRIGAGVIAAALLLGPSVAVAQPLEPSIAAPAAQPALILPTRIVGPRQVSRTSPADREAILLASSLDVLLSDTAQDLGLQVELSERSTPRATPRESELAVRARALGGYVVATSVEPVDGEIELRMVLADAGSPLLRVRAERVARSEVPVRAVILLRDLLRGARSPTAPAAVRPPAASAELAQPVRSDGRTVLAVNATLFGGYLGFSVLRASASDDPRLLYPLLAVGAGVGLGTSVIAAEEWNTTVGDAWFLAASAWWPSLAGHLIYEGRFSEFGSPDERWTFGLVGGATGVALGTLVLATRDVSEGGAAAAHSGGGLGLVFGGLTELFVRGDIDETPFAGMGYGAGAGWLLGAALLSRVDVSTGRVLAIDLGALLGGLGGAALASPLLFEEPTTDQQRGWVGATAGAAVVGAGLAWFMTRPGPEPARPTATATVTATRSPRLAAASAELPALGLVPRPALRAAASSGEDDHEAPIYGVSWRGRLR